MDHTMLYDIFNRRVPTEAEILEELQNVRSLNAMAQNEISKKQKEIQELTQQIVSMVNSRSWKITQPLRTILQAKRDKKLEK